MTEPVLYQDGEIRNVVWDFVEEDRERCGQAVSLPEADPQG